ncbi:hypothetical protein CDAR_19151 [Caerostris darwini]|uniref:Uncharacterized protein n=1 Tax=Caerostris darwini TaxID=1538125 RepID=A0AAV4WD20_9ARAC|nr:hypothetical protein CDAR_19151 [Caerostris darwini]
MPAIFLHYRWFMLRFDTQDWIRGDRTAMVARMVPRLVNVVVLTHYALTIRERLNLRLFNCVCLASFIQYGFMKPVFHYNWRIYTFFNTVLYTGAVTIGCTADFIRYAMRFLVTKRLGDWLMTALHLFGTLFVSQYLVHLYRDPYYWFTDENEDENAVNAENAE